MRRYELGMTLDYVSNWGKVEAVREIFQNALDEEIKNPDNKWYFNYDKDSCVLTVGNKLSKLSTESLLLGSTTKRGDSSTIGTHGEGYKVATIVLLRNDCEVRIYNYNEKEIWTAKIINSKRYKTKVGVFDVDKIGFFSHVPEHNLIFEITNIDEEDYEKIKESNLWLQDDLGEVINSTRGRVLLDERFRGKVFVKGLYVCNKEQLMYGYDLNPEYISLDRDRGLIDSFNLQYTLGGLIIGTKDADFISRVRKDWDGFYIKYFDNSQDGFMQDVYNKSYEEFTEKYGRGTHPVSDMNDFNRLQRKGVKVAMVSSQEHYFITNSKNYESNGGLDDVSLCDELNAWFDKVKGFLSEELISEGEQLIEEVVRELG